MNNPYKVRLIDGVLYDPWSPTGPAPSPETVAHGLANLNRYGGHARRPFSVGEHTIWVALYLACGGSENAPFGDVADALAREGKLNFLVWPTFCHSLPADRARMALLGLIHDAPEGCGLVDVPSPISRHLDMAEYKQAHERCYEWLCRGWGIDMPTQEERARVKEVDHSVLGAEMAIRSVNSDKRVGSGEDLPPWANLELGTDHSSMSKLGYLYTSTAWSSAFHKLRR